MIKGFTAGAFDICHAGHLIMFEECKKHCNYLIVGLQTNPSSDRDDKNKPIQTIFERYMQLRACKYIDEIIPYDDEEDLFNLLACIKPNVRIMGEDWKDKPNVSRDKLPEIEVIYNSRKHNFSSSGLRQRIKNA
jgi:glycerol-3-phosphate cytidylyltransferase